jgi:hypothetical protein
MTLFRLLFSLFQSPHVAGILSQNNKRTNCNKPYCIGIKKVNKSCGDQGSGNKAADHDAVVYGLPLHLVMLIIMSPMMIPGYQHALIIP